MISLDDPSIRAQLVPCRKCFRCIAKYSRPAFGDLQRLIKIYQMVFEKSRSRFEYEMAVSAFQALSGVSHESTLNGHKVGDGVVA